MALKKGEGSVGVSVGSSHKGNRMHPFCSSKINTHLILVQVGRFYLLQEKITFDTRGGKWV
jgi:hypothetical protein